MEDPQDKPVLLVVEGDRLRQDAYGLVFRPLLRGILTARTVKAASELIAKHPEIDLVILGICDTADPAQPPDTLSLINELRDAQFAGIIIGTSDSGYHRQCFGEAGCQSVHVPTEVTTAVNRILSHAGDSPT
ncbi:MAG: hypothetical protein RL141_63 [Candidatus Parcubacteria bacterium]|jgi:hypothetical protein